MKMKYTKWAAAVWAGLVLMATGFAPSAFGSEDLSAIRVHSVYTAADGGSRSWEIVRETVSETVRQLAFYAQGHMKTTPFCTLNIDSDSGEVLEWRGMGKPDKDEFGAGLLILPGYPAPCDMLLAAVYNPELNQFTDHISAGGKQFSRKYTLTRETLSEVTARTEGFLKYTSGPVAGTLTMITVLDEKDSLVVRQLWSDTTAWWLYEQTPFRRSWRLP